VTDLTDSPRLPDAYTDYRGSATDEAAYAAMLSRVQAPVGAPPPQGGSPQAGPQAQPQPPTAPGATEEPGFVKTAMPEPGAAAGAAARSTAPSEEMIQAEMQRLATEKVDAAKYANPEVARAAALKNLGAANEEEAVPRGTEAATAAQGGYAAVTSAFNREKALEGRFARDVGVGALETPGAVVRGMRDSVQSSLDGAADLGTWLEKAGNLPVLRYNVPGVSGYDPAKPFLSLVSGAERDELHRPFEGTELPGRFEQTTVTANLVKGVTQFATSMALAGREMKLLGVPTQAAGWVGRGLTAARGFLAMFQGFDGGQHRLSDLIQQVPALRNPVTSFLSTKPDDNEAVGRLKNAVEGSALAQATDGVVAGLRVLRGAFAAHETAQAAVEAAASAPPPRPSAGLDALGEAANEENAARPTVAIAKDWGLPEPASLQTLKLSAAAKATEGMEPHDVTPVKVTHEVGEVGDHVARSPNGEIHAQESGDYLLVNRSDVAEEARGKGEAIAMMERLQQEAEQRGLKLGSNVSVSPDAQRVYAGLERRGYQVTQNPAEESETTGNLVSKDGRPVFEVGPKVEGVQINFARVNSGEDVQKVMQDLADRFSGDINTARRGVRTFQQTELGAQAEDAFKTLMDRRVGQPLNAEQGLAARQLWASSASKVIELSDIATKAPTVENLFAFRRMLATHAAIQQEVIAARTETARALGAWRIPAGDDPLRIEQMVQSLSADAGLKGGAQTALTLAQKVQELAAAQDYKTIDTFLEKSAYARTRDAVLEGYTNALLTAPLTHVKVIASNTATIGLRIAERAVAAKIDQLMGNTDGVAAGEAAAQVSGLVGGFKDALRFAGKISRSVWAEEPWEGGRGLEMPALENDPLSNAIQAARTGQYSLKPMGDPEYMQSAGAISSAALRMSDAGFVGQGVDYLGQLARMPGRSLTAEHDFFRSIGYRMELNALATRQATQDVLAGRIAEDGMGNRIAELLENPPPQLRMDAVNGTLYQTFTDAPGKLAERIGELRNDYPLLRVLIPFYKIPSRILAFTGERTPLAPAMQTFRDNIAAGGARQSLAMAQMGLGTMTMLATADAVFSGQLTGSGPAEKGTRAVLENEGWQPYSMKVGNRWVQYNRLEPTGSAMALAADAVEAMQHFHAGVNGDDPDTANLALATTFAIANDITSKSYLQGLSNFFGAMSGDPSKAGHAILSETGSLVPAGLAALDRVTDPNKREVYRMIDAIRARTPGMSEGLPPLRGPWGEPIPNGSGMGASFDLFSPFGTRPAANEPIDAELLRQQIDIPRTPSRTAIHGVTLDLNRIDPKLYSRYQELAGNGYKGPDGLGLKDALNALVTGNHPYSPTYQRLTDGPDGTKADMIRDIVAEYRNGAKEQVLQENAGVLGPMIQDGIAAKQFIKAGPQ